MQMTPQRAAWTFSPVRLMVEIGLIFALALGALELFFTNEAFFADLLLGPPWAWLTKAVLLLLLASPAVFWRLMAAARRRLVRQELQRNERPIRSAIAVTALAQLVGLLLTWAWVDLAQRNHDEAGQLRFDRYADQVEEEARHRFRAPFRALEMVGVAYMGGREPSATELEQLVAASLRSDDLPSRSGVGMVERVERAQLQPWLEQIRRQGTGLQLRTVGEAPDLFIVSRILPAGADQAAIGFDLGQEPRRREALERALRTGRPAVTSPLALIATGGSSVGLLYALPLPATPNGLRRLLVMPVQVADLLRTTQVERSGQIHLAMDVPATDGAAPTPRYTRTTNLKLGDRDISLHLSSTPAFEASLEATATSMLGIAGVALSFLMALSVWLLAAGRVRAQRLAQDMTADLERLAQVARHTSNSVLVTDAQHRILWVNEGFERMTGYPLAEALGKTPGQLLASGESPEAARQLETAVKELRSCRAEVIDRRRDGRTYWSSVDLHPRHDASGRVTGFIEVQSDIDAQKQLQAMLESVLESLPNGLAVFDAGLTLVRCNRMYRHLLELPDQMFADGPPTFEQLVRFLATRGDYGPGDVETWVQRRVATLKLNQPYALGVTQLCGRMLEVRGSPMPHGGWVLTMLDVTEVNAAHARLRQIVAELPCGLVVLDADLKILMHNHVYRQLLNLPDELLGRPGVGHMDVIRHLVEQGDFEDEEPDAVVQRLRAERVAGPYVVERLRPNGRWLRIHGTPLSHGGYISTYEDITDFRQALVRAEEQSRQLDTLVSNLPGMVFRCKPDRDWTMVYVSDGSTALTGYRPEELIGNRVTSFAQLVHPDDRDWLWQQSEQALMTGLSTQTEYRIVDREGRVRWLMERDMPQFDADGRVLFLEGFIQDVTPRKLGELALQRAHQQLAQTTAQLQATLDHIPQGVELVSPDGTILLASQRMIDMLKLEEDIVGRTVGEVIRSQIARGDLGSGFDRTEVAVRDYFEHAKRDGTFGFAGAPKRYTRVDKEGRTIEVRTDWVDGFGWVRTFTDVSDYVAATTRKAESEALWRIALDGAGDGVFDLDFGRRVVQVSPGWRRLFGYGDEDGGPDFDFMESGMVHPDDQAMVTAAQRAHMFEGKPYVSEHRARCRDGSWKWIEARGEIVARDAQGTPLRVIGVHSDISARKAAEAALFQAHAEVSDKTAQLQATLDHVAQGVMMVDAQQRIAFLSRRACELLEIPSEMIGRGFEEIVRYQAARGDFGAEFQAVDESARDYVREAPATERDRIPLRYTRRTPSGRTLEVATTLLASGGWVRTFTDVTDYVRALSLKAESEALWKVALDGAGDGVWDYNIPARHVDFSAGWLNLFGYPQWADGCSLAQFNSLIHPEDAEKVRQAQRATSSSGTSYRGEFRLRSADGSWKWVAARGEVVGYDGQGRPTRVIGVHSDITARKLAEANLAEQLDELRRWQSITLGREERLLELKSEINDLLRMMGRPIRYGTGAGNAKGKES